MRIKLSDSKRFVDEILQKEDISLKQFAKKMNINYSNLKQYRRGEKTFSLEVYNLLINLSPNKSYWDKFKQSFDDNWGAIKGGESSASHPNRLKMIKYARGFRKIKKVEIKLNKNFCEFYGALLGDGCISKYKDYEGNDRIVIQFSGNKRLDSEYFKYLKNMLNQEYGLYVYYYEYKNENVCILSIKNKGLCLDLNKNLGVPIGLKYEKLYISEKISLLPWDIKKYVLRGLFDTDGCILANKRENYRYPWIAIASKSRRFLEQIKKMLREQGYPAYITGKDVNVRGIANVKKWFSDIGSSNSRNILKYEYFLRHKYLPARLL